MSKEMGLRRFKREVYEPAMKGDKWNFNLFNIKCKKCNSTNVEFNGITKQDTGYYDEHYAGTAILIKCHSCGNAMIVKQGDYDATNGIEAQDFYHDSWYDLKDKEVKK